MCVASSQWCEIGAIGFGHGRGAVREGHRTEGRLAGGPAVDVPAQARAVSGRLVLGRQLHHQVVRVLLDRGCRRRRTARRWPAGSGSRSRGWCRARRSSITRAPDDARRRRATPRHAHQPVDAARPAALPRWIGANSSRYWTKPLPMSIRLHGPACRCAASIGVRAGVQAGAGVVASREEGAGHRRVRRADRPALRAGAAALAWAARAGPARATARGHAAIATMAASRQTDCDRTFGSCFDSRIRRHERARARRARPKDQMRSGAAARATNGGRMTRDRREAGPPEASANATPLGCAGPQTAQARSGAAMSAARWVVQFRGRPEA